MKYLKSPKTTVESLGPFLYEHLNNIRIRKQIKNGQLSWKIAYMWHKTKIMRVLFNE